MEEKLNKELNLPPGAHHYDFRIGGHTHVRGKIKLGMLKHNDGNILKPLLSDDIRSVRELSFYKQMSEVGDDDPVLQDLKSFIPSFYGTWETSIDGTDIKYLCIEDICGTFQNPSVLDLKIGRVAYDPLASEEKIRREQKKYPPLGIFGFRILGMKVYDHCKQLYTLTNKAFGLSLNTADQVNLGLSRFYDNKLGQINCLILSGFYHKLLQLKNWFTKQGRLHFISSSVLFVHEGSLLSWHTWLNENSVHVINLETCRQSCGDNLKEFISLHYSDCSPVLEATNSEQNKICKDCCLHQDICSSLQTKCNLIRMSMLDFAHVFPSTEEDSNYIFGLDNLLSHMQQLIKKYMNMYL